MLENLQLFWDFFFYPLTIIDDLGLVGDVLLMAVIVLSVVTFCYWCVGWPRSISRI